MTRSTSLANATTHTPTSLAVSAVLLALDLDCYCCNYSSTVCVRISWV